MVTVRTFSELVSAIDNREEEIQCVGNIPCLHSIIIDYTTSISGLVTNGLYANTSFSEKCIIHVTQNGRVTFTDITLSASTLDCMALFIDGGEVSLNAQTYLGATYSSTKSAIVIGAEHSGIGGKLTMIGVSVLENIAHSAIRCYSNGTIEMYADSSISNNQCTAVYLQGEEGLPKPKLIMSDFTAIFNNRTLDTSPSIARVSYGDMIVGIKEGDIPNITHNSSALSSPSLLLENGSTLAIGYGVQFNHNTSIYANNSAVEVGGNAKLTGNSGERGGAIIISDTASLTLKGNAEISGNTADKGNGIYMEGILRVKQSPIVDGIYYPNGNNPAQILDSIAHARLHLEPSDYINPQGIPVLVAVKDDGYSALTQQDADAWIVPSTFPTKITGRVNDNKIVLDVERFKITYANLNGAINPNPLQYTAEDLPLTLLPPLPIAGNVFRGWFDQFGQVTTIPVGSAQDINLSARWDKLFILFLPNGDCVSDMPQAIRVTTSVMQIPNVVPKRTGYKFICWNTPSSASGKVYFPNDSVAVEEYSLRLSAQWLKC